MDYKLADWKSPKTYAEFLDDLKSKSKDESIEDRARHVAIINTNQFVYALKMSDVRNIAKQIAKGDYKTFLAEAKDDSFEETLIQGLVIAGLKNIDEQIEYFKTWIFKMDNWGVCDSTVTTMKTFAKSKQKDQYFDGFLGLCYSDEEFVARFGIVVLMCYFLDESHILKVLEMCKKVTNKAYYVQMAVAWLLSVAFVKFRDETYALISEKVLDKFTQNKAISKCRDSFRVSREDKEKLVQFRIK